MWTPAVLLLVFAPACCVGTEYFYGDYDGDGDSDFYDGYEEDQSTTSAFLTTTTELKSSKSVGQDTYRTDQMQGVSETTKTHTAWDIASLQIQSITVEDTKPVLTTTVNYVLLKQQSDFNEKETSPYVQSKEYKDVKVVEVIMPVVTTTSIKTSVLAEKKTLNSPEISKAEILSTMLSTAPMNSKILKSQFTNEMNERNMSGTVPMEVHTRIRRYDAETKTMNPKVMKEVKGVLKDLIKARSIDNEDKHYAAFDITKTTDDYYNYLEYKTIGRKTLNAQDIKDVEVVLKDILKNRKMNWTTSPVTTKTTFTGVFDSSDKIPLTSTTTFGTTGNQITDFSLETTTVTGVELSSTLGDIDKIVNWEPVDNMSLIFVHKLKEPDDNKSFIFVHKPQLNKLSDEDEGGKEVDDKTSLLFIRKAKNSTVEVVEEDLVASSSANVKLESRYAEKTEVMSPTRSTVKKPTRSGKPKQPTAAKTTTFSGNTDVLKGFLLPDVMNTSPTKIPKNEYIDKIEGQNSFAVDTRNFNDSKDILKSFASLNKTFARDDGKGDATELLHEVETTTTVESTTVKTTTTTVPTTTTMPTTTTVPTTTKHVCPTLYPPTTSTPTPLTTERPTVRLDVDGLLALIANLTYEYDMNLTERFNETLIKYSVPTCPTPTTTPVPTTTVPEYNFANTSIVGKCFVCGLDKTAIPQDAYCGDAFAGDFLPLVPQDPRARGQIARYRKYCRFLDVRNYLENPEEPRAVYGRFTGGCSVRWTDLSNVYTQRTCRNKRRAVMGKHFASKRMAKLEMALRSLDNGCIISPMATLLPLSRGISLYARFHACVCTGAWCNSTVRCMATPWIYLLMILWPCGNSVVGY